MVNNTSSRSGNSFGRQTAMAAAAIAAIANVLRCSGTSLLPAVVLIVVGSDVRVFAQTEPTSTARTLPPVTVTAPVSRVTPRAQGARGRGASARRTTTAVAASDPTADVARAGVAENQVVAISPFGGTGVPRDKVPSMVQSVSTKDVDRTRSLSVIDTLMQRIPDVSVTDVQGNGFTQDLRYRGFAASPLQGTPQGLAVYQNGIRINEAFGNTVNWDLIPTKAIDHIDVWTNNPVFGLNALGGAVNIGMKNGFTYAGKELEMLGGSYGRAMLSGQYGQQIGDMGAYLAVEGLREDGWRYNSPSQIGRIYSDFGWKGERAELHLIAAAAQNDFGLIGPTPIELLARDYRSIYTWPQTTRNQMGLLALTGKVEVSDIWTLQSNVYARRFRQAHVDGNDADVERCSSRSSFPTALCLEDDDFVPPPGGKTRAWRNQFVILDGSGKPIPFVRGVPYGIVDRTDTAAWTFGSSLQASSDARLFDHGNYLAVGGSIDHGRVSFDGTNELAYIYPNLFVGPNPTVPGTGQVIRTLGNIGYAPVGLNAKSTYYGLYAVDTFDITTRLSLTAGARLNVAQIGLRDALGSRPELNGDHLFSRINPMGGITYRFLPNTSVYAGYSESNRAPTPLKLGCSDLEKPCLFESFLVADPPLNQVISRTYEAGLRGDWRNRLGRLDWKIGAFRTDLRDDIVMLASAIQGRGFYQNVPATRREGLEFGLQLKTPRWLAYVNYSYIDATFQFEGDLAARNNPSVDARRNIHITPGKRMPMIPQHQLKVGADYFVTPKWKLGADLVAASHQYYVGDEANLNDPLPAFWTVNLHTSYQVSRDIEVFGLVTNLFNWQHPVYGTYFSPSSVNAALANPLTDRRTNTPAQPFSIYVGLNVKL